MNLMTKKICANVCAAVMSITAVGICGELLLDNKSVGAEKAPAVQVKNVEAQSVKTTAATEVYDFVKFKKSLWISMICLMFSRKSRQRPQRKRLQPVSLLWKCLRIRASITI